MFKIFRSKQKQYQLDKTKVAIKILEEAMPDISVYKDARHDDYKLHWFIVYRNRELQDYTFATQHATGEALAAYVMRRITCQIAKHKAALIALPTHKETYDKLMNELGE